MPTMTIVAPHQLYLRIYNYINSLLHEIHLGVASAKLRYSNRAVTLIKQSVKK